MEKHYWSSVDRVVLQVRKTKDRELRGPLNTWQGCTGPSFGPAQQGPWPGRAMGSRGATSQGVPGAGTEGPETGPWAGVGRCSGPLRAIGALRALTTQNWAQLSQDVILTPACRGSRKRKSSR